ncbi:ATP-binding protein [Dysgonomonas sp. 511]|uniref:hybrid sensor histidine kinase/response regulator transcription factor n=1 Tax=Dysgonomonas sp. 511 TaxID=2302930 RepID=UPI0013D14294|nr:ATP-binding protein [Dysgonomonas sp. 511]NDV77577.1 response regulator [Dysgonomonas sp. 511]
MKNRYIYLIPLIFLLATQTANSQQYIFRHLDIIDGLSDNQIRSLSMTPDNRLAIKTASILNIYNGATFDNFYHDKHLEYRWNYWRLPKEYYDDKGRIWMKERDYLLIFDLKTNQYNYNIGEELSQMGVGKRIKNLFIDNSKNFWFVAENNDFLFYDISQKTLHTITAGTDSFVKEFGVPREMAQYKNFCWVVYSSGLIRCWDYTSREFVSQDPHLLNIIDDSTDRLYIHTTSSGDVWLMHNKAVSLYNRTNQSWQEITRISGHSSFFTCMDLDMEGNVWLGTSSGELRHIKHDTFAITSMKGLNLDNGATLVNDIYTVFADDNNGVWVGTLFQGLCYYQPNRKKFQMVQVVPNGSLLTSDNVRCFIEEEDGSIILGTKYGLSRYTPETEKIEQIHKSLSDILCLSLYRDSKKRLWVATFLNGLYCIDGNSIRNYKQRIYDNDQEPIQNTARDIYEDSYGRFWVSFTGGVGEFFPQTGEIKMLYKTHPKVSYHKIDYKIYPVNKDSFAVIGESGIYYYDTQKDSLWIPEIDSPENPKFKDLSIKYYCILNDSKSLEWYGTEAGLKIWDNKGNKLYNITVNEGLPNNTISAILEDANGLIWASTASGISKIEAKEVDGEYKFSIVNFGPIDGLQSGKFYNHAAIKARNGMMYFGGVHGFNLFNPQKITYNETKYAPMFVSFSLFNTPVKEGDKYNNRTILEYPINQTKEIKLNHNENFITLEFSGLNYINPSQTYFRYKLENFDHEWTEIVTEGLGKVTYTGLAPGTYKFVVYTANNDKIWGQQASEMTVIIKPPFWATIYAIVLYCLLFVGAIIYSLALIDKKNKKRLMKQQLINEQKQKEELDQMKFRFFTNISHEFRTPLTLILMPLETMIKDAKDSGMRDKLRSIYTNAKDLLSLVNQLLDFRKLEMKGEELKLTRVNIKAFLQNIYIQFKDSVSAKNISFIIDSGADSENIYMDEGKMHKVMNNLLSNSLKYTPEGGSITIVTNTVFRNEQEYLKVSVSDTGRGIQEKDINKIFTRFYQSSEQKSELVGSGIGLHLVNEYISLHKGEISVENKKEGGATFTFLIPAWADSRQEILPAEENCEETEEVIDIAPKKTILVIEDNTEFRRFLTEQLNPYYNVIEAPDGEEGEKLAVQKSPDLIVSDIMMPKMDGITLCILLKKNIQTSHIPLILLTARSSDEAKIEGYEAGADSYISKPFSFEVLHTRIKKLIEQQETRQELFHKTIDISPSSITITSLDEELVQKALACVEKNMDNPEYSVEELSSDIGLSRVHLYRKLQVITGQSPINFIRAIRLKRAAQYLRDSQYNVSEIADLVGFNTLKYFNKYFKEEFGTTPSQYRADNMKQK